MMDEKKETPVYSRIVLDIEHKIETGEWKEGQKLPGERELCSYYGVARGTLKAAFSHLQRAGALKQIRGSGTYVESRERKTGDLERQADNLAAELNALGFSEGEILGLGEAVILHKN